MLCATKPYVDALANGLDFVSYESHTFGEVLKGQIPFVVSHHQRQKPPLQMKQ